MQIVALEDALADENYMLQQMALNHTLPIQLKSINCTNISAADLQVLQASITTIENDLQAINTQLSTLNESNTYVMENLQREYDWATVYLLELKNVTAQLNKCPAQSMLGNATIGIANVTNYANISNLSVGNWIYGNTSSA